MTQKKIITVTLNPWLDRTLTTHFLALGYRNRTQGETRLDPSGRGVNIARAVNSLEAPTHALLLLGNDAVGRAYESLLKAEGFSYTLVPTTAGTSSNTIIFDNGHHQETQLIDERGEVAEAELEQVAKQLPTLIQSGDIVVFAGSLSPGIPTNIYQQLVEIAHQSGAQAVVVGGSEAMGLATSAQPELTVLSQQEAESYFNCPVRSIEDVVYVSNQLRRETNGQVLIEMREKHDALLVTESGRWLVKLSGEHGGTSTGVWDGFVAGYLVGRLADKSFVEALEMGATTSGYAAEQTGTGFGTIEEIRELAEEVTVEPVERRPIVS